MLVRRSLEDLVEFCRSNTRGGKPLSEDSLIRSRLAQIACELEACVALAYRFAWEEDKGVAGPLKASALKVFGDELTIHTAYLGSEIMGAYGQVKFSKWAPLESFYEDFYQDAYALSIAAGTDEIQRNIIAWEGLGLPRMR